jgi:hypothetical protein
MPKPTARAVAMMEGEPVRYVETRKGAFKGLGGLVEV